jgi:hypothetical protein
VTPVFIARICKYDEINIQRGYFTPRRVTKSIKYKGDTTINIRHIKDITRSQTEDGGRERDPHTALTAVTGKRFGNDHLQAKANYNDNLKRVYFLPVTLTHHLFHAFVP